MRILTIGKHGQVASSLQKINFDSRFDLYFLSSKELDLSSKNSIITNIQLIKPDIIINTGAYTNLDENEINKNKALSINSESLKIISKFALKNGIFLIHLSTDYVFDGTKLTPYNEDDEKKPLSMYAKTKSQGEDYVTKYLQKFVILRTSSVFSSVGNNFVKTMLRLNKEGNNIKVVSDQMHCPTSANYLAIVIKQICNLYIQRKNIEWGIYHICNKPGVSWFEFAKKIFEIDNNLSKHEKNIILTKISLKEYPSQVIRPIYSILNIQKAISAFNIKPLSWEEELVKTIKEIRSIEH